MSPRPWAVWIVDDVDHLEGLLIKLGLYGLRMECWSCGPMLPNSLVDLLDTGDREEEKEEENEDELDFDDFSESDDE